MIDSMKKDLCETFVPGDLFSFLKPFYGSNNPVDFHDPTSGIVIKKKRFISSL
jgi:hypothetical protein